MCVTDGPSPTNGAVMDFTSLNGITYNCLETFTEGAKNWTDWEEPWIALSNSPFVPWEAADPSGRTVIDTQDLIPTGLSSDANWTAECAAGDFNTYATQFAKNMVAAGLGNSVIRLAHEMNGTWYDDDLGTTQAQWTQWDQCWDQEVTAMRAAPGEHLLFDWNVNANYQDFPLADIYPGNAYVDIIGIDFYDQTRADDPGRWAAGTLCGAGGGAGRPQRAGGVRRRPRQAAQHPGVGHGLHPGRRRRLRDGHRQLRRHPRRRLPVLLRRQCRQHLAARPVDGSAHDRGVHGRLRLEASTGRFEQTSGDRPVSRQSHESARTLVFEQENHQEGNEDRPGYPGG